MSQMIMIKPDEAKIMQLYLLWNNESKISETTWYSIEFIQEVLLRKHVAAAITDIEIEDTLRDNKLKKIKWAKLLLDKVILWVQKIANDIDAAKWNKNHVELFKLMLSDLAKEEKSIINNIQNQINIQVNNNIAESNWVMDELDELITAFPSNYQDIFWSKVILLANQMKDELSARWTKLIVK